MRRRRPYIRTARPADSYAQEGERIAEFGTPSGGGLMLVKDQGGKTYVELYRMDEAVTVSVPARNAVPVELRVPDLVAYATGEGDSRVHLTDGRHGAHLTPNQARALATELRMAAQAAELAAFSRP